MADTVKRGPGRPKAEPEVHVGDLVIQDEETGEITVIPKPFIDRKLVQTPHGTVMWRHPETKGETTLAFGWSDGLVTWGVVRNG